MQPAHGPLPAPMGNRIETTSGRPAHGGEPLTGRKLAGAPISWGVCEVPGWGHILPPERVLAEMASLGLEATEMGPVGYLPPDIEEVRALLTEHNLGLVGAFVPLVLHERSLDQARAVLDELIPLMSALDGEVLVVAAVTDAAWSPPVALAPDDWRRIGEHLERASELAAQSGLRLALHPHAGTLVESADDIDSVLEHGEVDWCLDTGHLAIGGADPVEFVKDHADRIVHVHLKDVDLELAGRVRSAELPLVEATRLGLFRPLGAGDASIEEVVGELDRHGYERWLVLEQDTTLTGEEPPVGRGPVLDVRESIDYLATLAPANGGGIPKR
jgi:inosose dehydratase